MRKSSRLPGRFNKLLLTHYRRLRYIWPLRLYMGLVNTSCGLIAGCPTPSSELMRVSTQFGWHAAIVRSGTGGMPKAKSGRSAETKAGQGQWLIRPRS